MIDKPLYGNPLAGGGGTLDRLSNKIRGGLSFRQEDDMGRYVADNDPGGIAAGYSNLQDYLAAGNKLPEFGKPLPFKAFENPALANSIIGNGIYDMNTSGMLSPGAPGTSIFNATPPSVPVSEQTPFLEGVSQDIFGNPNIIRDSDGNPLPSLGPIQDNNAFPIGFGSGDSRDITSTLPTLQFPEGTGPLSPVSRAVTPIVSGPETFEIATQQAPMDSYNRVGQQIMGPNQDEMLGTLKNIEQGIASLVGNYGQDFNSNKSSNYGDFDNFGIGSFFPPYGGMYG